MDLADNPSDPEFDRLGSFEFTWGFIDECQEISGKARQIALSRMRHLSWEGWKTRPKLLMTCNPWKNFIYTDFYMAKKKWIIPEYRKFIPSLATDNPYLPKEYIETLNSLDKVNRERLLFGNFEYDDDPRLLFNIDTINQLFLWNTGNSWTKERHYITCDAARKGKDKAVICLWKWFTCIKIKVFDVSTTWELEEFIRNRSEKYEVGMDYTIIDEVWVGWGLVDNLWCRGFIANASPIHPYASKLLSYKRRNYADIKTQAYYYLEEYARLDKIKINIDWELKETIIEELWFMRLVDVENDTKIRMESKKDLKIRLGRSPDFADCISFRMYWVIKDLHEWVDEVDNWVDSDDLLDFLMEKEEEEAKEGVDFDLYE